MKTRIINNLTEVHAEEGKWITNGAVCVKSAYPVSNPGLWSDTDACSIPDMSSYDEEVDKLIRERYSTSNELSILRQRDTKPEEFAAYNAYCEECKHITREVLTIKTTKE